MAVGVKDPALPSAKVVSLAEVNTGSVPTIRVKDWLALGATPLAAPKVSPNVPVSVGVPVSAPWLNEIPVGNAPDSVTVGVGVPEAVTEKLLSLPSVKVAELAEVMAGAASTVRVNDWLAAGPTPLAA